MSFPPTLTRPRTCTADSAEEGVTPVDAAAVLPSWVKEIPTETLLSLWTNPEARYVK